MKKQLLVLLAPFLLLPACQTQQMKETIADQDQQLELAQQERRRLSAQQESLRAQNAELREKLRAEQASQKELQSRLSAMEAEKAASDAEVDSLRGRLVGSGVGVSRRGNVLVLDLPSALTFPSGSATLNEKGRSSLAKVAEILKKDYGDRILWVEGHTDDQPLRRTKQKWGTNLRLSVERAMAVSTYLSGSLGIDSSRIRVSGYGEWAPKVPNDSKQHRSENRRVEILILKD